MLLSLLLFLRSFLGTLYLFYSCSMLLCHIYLKRRFTGDCKVVLWDEEWEVIPRHPSHSQVSLVSRSRGHASPHFIHCSFVSSWEFEILERLKVRVYTYTYVYIRVCVNVYACVWVYPVADYHKGDKSECLESVRSFK